jgi:hypothetical protein
VTIDIGEIAELSRRILAGFVVLGNSGGKTCLRELIIADAFFTSVFFKKI